MNKAGFTLIELLLVIALMGVMLVLAVPAIRDVFPGDQLKKASRQLIGLERQLRAEAVRDQVDYVLCFNVSDSSYWIISSDMTPEKQDEIKKHRRYLPSDVAISDIVESSGLKTSAGEVRIMFKKDNLCSPAVIHLTHHRDQMTIVINPFLGVTDVYEHYVDTTLKKTPPLASL